MSIIFLITIPLPEDTSIHSLVVPFALLSIVIFFRTIELVVISKIEFDQVPLTITDEVLFPTKVTRSVTSIPCSTYSKAHNCKTSPDEAPSMASWIVEYLIPLFKLWTKPFFQKLGTVIVSVCDVDILIETSFALTPYWYDTLV